MRSPFISGSIFLGLSLAAVADVVRGTLLNDDDPYFIRGDDGNLYKAEWYGGSSLFSEGDEVILTDSYGLQKMIDDAMDETADVWVEEISAGYPRHYPRPVPTPNFTPVAPYLTAVPTPTPKPTPVSTPTATPTLNYNNAKWPDGTGLCQHLWFRYRFRQLRDRQCFYDVLTAPDLQVLQSRHSGGDPDGC
jgi:hypothetical protein